MFSMQQIIGGTLVYQTAQQSTGYLGVIECICG